MKRLLACSVLTVVVSVAPQPAPALTLFDVGLDQEVVELIRSLPEELQTAYLEALAATSKEIKDLVPIVLRQVVEANATIVDEWSCLADKTVADVSIRIPSFGLPSWCELKFLRTGMSSTALDQNNVERCELQKTLTLQQSAQAIMEAYAKMEKSAQVTACSFKDTGIAPQLLFEKAEIGVLTGTWSSATAAGCDKPFGCPAIVRDKVAAQIAAADDRDKVQAIVLFDAIPEEKWAAEDYPDIEGALRSAYLASRSIERLREARLTAASQLVPPARTAVGTALAIAKAYEAVMLPYRSNPSFGKGTIFGLHDAEAGAAYQAFRAAEALVTDASAVAEPADREYLQVTLAQAGKARATAQSIAMDWENAREMRQLMTTGRIE